MASQRVARDPDVDDQEQQRSTRESRAWTRRRAPGRPPSPGSTTIRKSRVASPISPKERKLDSPVDLAAPAEEHREAEDEEQVADHGAGERAADDLGHSIAFTANRAMISSGALPNVAFRKPPIPGPVCSAACSVASPISQASGISASGGEDELDASRRVGRRSARGRRRARARPRRRGCAGPRPPTSLATARALPEEWPNVKSCGASRKRPQSRRGTASAGTSRASSPSAGRGGVPPLRGPLRQGRLSGRLHRALVPLRVRVRGLGAHVRRLHAEGLRRRDRPRSPAGGRGQARRLRRRAGHAGAAADVPHRGVALLRGARRRPRLPQPGVPRAPGRAAELPRHRADQFFSRALRLQSTSIQLARKPLSR